VGALNTALQRWACPNEDNCGDRWQFILDRDGSKEVVESESISIGGKTDNFLKPDSCGYLIEAPPQAKEGDEIKVKVWQKTDANIWLVYGTEYKGPNTTTKKTSNGNTYTIVHPNKLWLTATATSSWRHGKFAAEFWYNEVEIVEEPEEPEPVPEEPTEPEPTEPEEEPVEEEPVEEDPEEEEPTETDPKEPIEEDPEEGGEKVEDEDGNGFVSIPEGDDGAENRNVTKLVLIIVFVVVAIIAVIFGAFVCYIKKIQKRKGEGRASKLNQNESEGVINKPPPFKSTEKDEVRLETGGKKHKGNKVVTEHEVPLDDAAKPLKNKKTESVTSSKETGRKNKDKDTRHPSPEKLPKIEDKPINALPASMTQMDLSSNTVATKTKPNTQSQRSQKKEEPVTKTGDKVKPAPQLNPQQIQQQKMMQQLQA
jgi:uncharacterized protein YpmB